MVKKGVSIKTGDTVAIKIIDKVKNSCIIEQIKKYFVASLKCWLIALLKLGYSF